MLHRTVQVDHPGDSDVFGRSRSSLFRRRSHARSAPLRQNNAIGSGADGGAKDRAEVVRVLHAVEQNQQPGFVALGFLYEVFEFNVTLRPGNQNNALVRGAAGGAVQLGFVDEAHGNRGAARRLYYRFDLRAFASLAHQQTFGGTSGGERLFDRVNAANDCHGWRKNYTKMEQNSSTRWRQDLTSSGRSSSWPRSKMRTNSSSLGPKGKLVSAT